GGGRVDRVERDRCLARQHGAVSADAGARHRGAGDGEFLPGAGDGGTAGLAAAGRASGAVSGGGAGGFVGRMLAGPQPTVNGRSHLYQRPKVPTLHRAAMPLINQGFAASWRVGTFGRWYY